MAITPSTMLPLGTPMPPFSLKATDGSIVSSREFDGAEATLVAFLCNHCPYVKHIQQGFVQFAREYSRRGVAIFAINSNDATSHPDDSFENMVKEVERLGYSFPYLHDPDQEVAKRFQASCTPDFFLFDHEDMLVYRGQFDDSRPGSNLPVTGESLRKAVDAVLSRHKVDPMDQKPSIGCNIKWIPGREPDYVLRGIRAAG